MVTLTERQQSELLVAFISTSATYFIHVFRSNKAILDYLQSRNLSQTAAAFQEEVGIDTPPDRKLDGILEKKWFAVIRLQRKVTRR